MTSGTVSFDCPHCGEELVIDYGFEPGCDSYIPWEQSNDEYEYDIAACRTCLYFLTPADIDAIEAAIRSDYRDNYDGDGVRGWP
jgi:hypothetical protein